MDALTETMRALIARLDEALKAPKHPETVRQAVDRLEGLVRELHARVMRHHVPER